MASALDASPRSRAADARRRRDLRQMQRRATGLLVLIAAAFVALIVFTDGEGWAAFAIAAAEGSLVGGLADWFAVTALFRRPLGLPIPHTAVIRERKDQFGETLGAFVQENFLSPDAVAERIRSSDVAVRSGAWLAEADNAATVARYAGEAAVAFADVVRDEEVHRLVDEELGRAVERIPVAQLSARALRLVTADGRHHDLFDALLPALERFLREHAEALRSRFAAEAPWWLPDAVQDRVFERLLEGVERLLASAADDPDHELRRAFDARVIELVDELERSPEMQQRAEQLAHELLHHPELRRWSAGLWGDVKEALRAQAADPDSRLRQRLAEGVTALGTRVRSDEALQARVEDAIVSGARTFVAHFQDEIAGLITSTVARWDPEETSDKLELLLGRDLQFIRINGTVVGGLAGLAIHALATAF